MKVRSPEEMAAFASKMASEQSPKAGSATVLSLSGDLGAGKTTFAQAFAKALGVEEDVTSPTFVIEKIYPLQGQRFARFIHIDAYRLEDPHELEVLGFLEELKDPANLILIEWPEKAAGLIPEGAIAIRFDIHGDERTISTNGKEESGAGN